jgi:short subunit dehydrogenase-like uncharacterized protein
MASADQTGPVAVYGATGFTGRLVAAELRRRDAEFVISGRDPGKLERLSAHLGGVPSRSAAADDPAALRSLFEPCAAVIACAGPFTLHGEGVLAAAAETGTHYVDTTGEQPFIRMVFECYGPTAERNGAALVPAMGFDYAPGDLIAELTAEGMGPLDEIVLAYAVRGFRATRGTMLSTMEIVGGGDVEYTDGALRPASGKTSRGTFRFPPPMGEQRMIRYPAGEPITVPRHVDTRNVRMMMSAGTAGFPAQLGPVLPVVMPAFGMAMRTPMRKALGAMVNRLPEGPSEQNRRAARFMIACDARAGSRSRRGIVTGADLYGLTALTTVQAAMRMSEKSFDRSGALAPAQAFDAASFLEKLAGFGVDHEVEPLPEPAPAPTA